MGRVGAPTCIPDRQRSRRHTMPPTVFFDISHLNVLAGSQRRVCCTIVSYTSMPPQTPYKPISNVFVAMLYSWFYPGGFCADHAADTRPPKLYTHGGHQTLNFSTIVIDIDYQSFQQSSIQYRFIEYGFRNDQCLASRPRKIFGGSGFLQNRRSALFFRFF